MTKPRASNPLNVLILGNGAREHAIADAISRSPGAGNLYVAPGNAGTAAEYRNLDIDPADPDAVIAACSLFGIGLVVVGPEALLAAGIADALRGAGIPTVGPGSAAARIESSKAWAKTIMESAGVPTAAAASFTDAQAAHSHVDSMGAPIVVKADGLASGKGVVVAHTTPDAHAAVDTLLAAAGTILIEEHMVGAEASVFALVDRAGNIALLPTATDYKRLDDHDEGPNTGGMGAVSPSPHMNRALREQVLREILRPVVDALISNGTPFEGILYAGLMLTADGPKVVEFNARLGDPEAQVVLPRIASDFLAHLVELVESRLGDTPVRIRPEAATVVTLAAAGYPAEPHIGLPLPDAFRRTGWLPIGETGSTTRLFHGATRTGLDGGLESAGGRVASAVAVAPTPAEARALAYQQVALSRFGGAHVRRDIGLDVVLTAVITRTEA